MKRQIVSVLQSPDIDHVRRCLLDYRETDLINTLFSSLCHPQEIVRWHAVSAFGLVVPRIAGRNLEEARIVMRRFLWMLNDESGGIGWGVPEAMGEVMACHEGLANEYSHMLVSYTLDDGPEFFQDGNFLEMPLLQQGVLWGLCRLAREYGSLLVKHRVQENLGSYFSSPDCTVRGMACRLSGYLGLSQYEGFLLGLSGDEGRVRLYIDGRFIDSRVGWLASEALVEIKKQC